MHDDPFTLTRQFGARVVEVDELGVDVVYLHNYRLAIIDSRLDPAQRAAVDGMVFQAALSCPRTS